MKNNSLEQTVLEMREYIRKEIAAGFDSADEICDSAVDSFSDQQDSSVLLPYAKDIVQEGIETQISEQANWEEVTDCDRLDQVFEDLEHNGIISRQNFSCCGNCGTYEIWDEMETAQSQGQIVRGYTFYHMQDTQHAVEGYGIYLSYGSIEDNDSAQISIANEIVGILNHNNLKTEWNGDLQRRILVKLDWKRRRSNK